jgi:hypothetical protein
MKHQRLNNNSKNKHMIKIFISYNENDTYYADALVRTLNRHRISTYSYRHNGPIPGTRVWDNIEGALSEAHFVALLWNSQTQYSDWVRLEAQTALNFDKYIIPVILEKGLVLPQPLNNVAAIQAYNDPAGWVNQFADVVVQIVNHLKQLEAATKEQKQNFFQSIGHGLKWGATALVIGAIASAILDDEN